MYAKVCETLHPIVRFAATHAMLSVDQQFRYPFMKDPLKYPEIKLAHVPGAHLDEIVVSQAVNTLETIIEQVWRYREVQS